jgi:orotidine-5'-phosphate decarboxylase
VETARELERQSKMVSDNIRGHFSAARGNSVSVSSGRHPPGAPVEHDMRTDIPPRERLIVALDVDTRDDAVRLVRALGEDVVFYKVGLQLFMQNGFPIVKEVADLGKKVFLDLKINDTPRTVENAVRMAANADVKLFTLQGNAATSAAAKLGRGEVEFPKFLQVTYLSSWDANDLRDYFHIPETYPKKIDLDEQVLRRSEGIISAGCDGVIASGSSVGKLRAKYPDLLIVTPGIRPTGVSTDDHKRSLTPSQAILAGANYLVVGRPIRDTDDPKGTATKIQEEIARALANKAA